MFGRLGGRFDGLPDGWNFEEQGVVMEGDIVENDAIIWRNGVDFSDGNERTLVPNQSLFPNAYYKACAFSPNSKHLALGITASPYLLLYKIEGDTFIKLPNPPTLPSNSITSLTYSPDGTKLSIAYSNSPYIYTYKVTGDTYTALPILSWAINNSGTDVKYSPDGSKFVITGVSYPGSAIYNVNGDTFTPIRTSALEISTGNRIAFSPNGKQFAVTYSSSPYIARFTINGDIITKIQDVYPNDKVVSDGVCYSPNGKYLLIAYTGKNIPRLSMYNASNEPIVFNPIEGIAQIANIHDIQFSSDGSTAMVARRTDPEIKSINGISMLQFNGSQLSIVPGEFGTPYSGNQVSFSNDGKYCCVATDDTVFIYTGKNTKRVRKCKASDTLDSKGNRRYGYATETKKTGEQIKVNLFPKLNIL